MSREIYRIPHVRESEADRTKREDEGFSSVKKEAEDFMVQSEVCTKEEIDAARESFFASIDFEKLKKIFADIYKKCGLNEEAMNFIGPERILLSIEGTADGFAGRYHVEKNYIDLVPANLRINENSKLHLVRFVLKDQIKEREHAEKAYGSLALSMVALLVHEETHAVGKNICIGIDQESNESLYHQSGYVRQANYQSNAWGKDAPTFQGATFAEREFPAVTTIFNLLSEGIVETVSRVVLDTYLEQTEWDKQDVAIYRETQKIRPLSLKYAEPVLLVDWITEYVAEYAGVSKETVFQALTRGLIEGETFADEEVQQLFTETLGAGFLEAISNMQYNYDPSYQQLMVEYKGERISVRLYIQYLLNEKDAVAQKIEQEVQDGHLAIKKSESE